ncbi:hypothetical protein [Nocardioides xinjiangensis]|uniref:hypothetical protein n=1 Tax=Nocardioides xinjiangensis TaxID=2817376 RepID=UPI001B312329|nr:hypothetical protein [Nocardioides sp. SYSU D00778]
MSQPTSQRPPQVTLAVGIVVLSSVVVLLSVWERVTTLGSLETQEAVRDALAEAPFSSLDLTVNATTDLIRVMCMVAAACACATAILGWYARRPDRAARLGLTLFAVPVFVTGMAAGGLAGSFVAAGAAMLWLQPAREWFATGRWTPPDPAAGRGRGAGRSAPPADPASPPDPWARPAQDAPQGPTSPPPASRPFGEPAPSGEPGRPGQPGAPAQGPVAPHASTSPYGQPYPPGHAQGAAAPWHQPARPQARPGALVAAFVITVVTAGGLLAMSLLWLAIAGLSPDFLMSVLEQEQPQLVEDGMTLQEVRAVVVAVSGAFIVWCAVALVLAGFAMARREWARRGLMASAAFSAGTCFVLVLTAPIVLVPAAAAVATVVCLRRGDVRRWFALDAR